MSDKPLFKDSDEQEALYSPQQLPEGAADNPEARDNADAAGDTLAGVMGAGVGTGGASGTGGAPGGVGPAVGAAALANEMEDKDANDR